MMDEDRRRDAQGALTRAERDSETLGGSALARLGHRLGDHFSGRDAAIETGSADWAEVWGRRIGRVLSVVGVVALAAWLGMQLGWW